ncbi:MAG: glutamyl-tRNA(Gln) amidotransferase subunit D [Candidatus Nanohaloarchaea archaeon]|jgi:glutamyl-tRNA(Gln) amidotransferase subunit D
MYSDKIQEILNEEEIDTGDYIKAGDYEGKLMPKPENGDPNSVIVKLESGYNIGVKTQEIELLEKRETEEQALTEVEHSGEKADILVLHTGGTIASRVSYEEGGVKPAFDPEDLIEMYPEVAEEVNLHSEMLAQMYSSDMEPEHWQMIAEKVDEVKEEYDGIIIGHGTDTMAYTGGALQLMLKGIDTGVMLLGSQRSSDRPSSDAPMNLYCVSKFLAETDFSGVGMCMHSSVNDDECVILPAAKSRKMHTSRRDTFEAINAEPIAKVDYETGEIEENFDNEEREYEFQPELDKDVRIIKMRPGTKVDEIDYLLEKNPDGVIIEGTGLGHGPVKVRDEKTEHHEQIREKISKLAENSVVVMTSQCINGRVNMNVYDYGLKMKEAGVISAEDMHPELAYVKLMWSLGQANSLDEAEQIMGENIAGEIQERSIYNE